MQQPERALLTFNGLVGAAVSNSQGTDASDGIVLAILFSRARRWLESNEVATKSVESTDGCSVTDAMLLNVKLLRWLAVK